MSTTYRVVPGDSFDLVARKVYGIEEESARIKNANPGVTEPFVTGAVLVIPALTNAPTDKAQNAGASNPDEVALLIGGERFRFWDRIRITRSLDSFDTVELGAPFEPGSSDIRAAFTPFSFKPLEVTVGGDPLFKGVSVDVVPSVDNTGRRVSASGYSLPGSLNDCTAPASSFPLEFNNQTLQEIAVTLCAPFGVSVEFKEDVGAAFERVACEPGRKVLGFLSELAKQRNLVITSSNEGALVFWRSITRGTEVARLSEGLSPLLSVTPFFSPQEYYSHITGIEPVVVGLPGSQFTVKNDRLEGVVRPFTFNVPDTIGADVKTAVEAKAGRMFGNMASYSIRVATWRDPSGALWEPNTLLKLTAPGAMIYSEYEFLIKSVDFNRERSSATATLNLVIPGAFAGQIPEALPWDE